MMIKYSKNADRPKSVLRRMPNLGFLPFALLKRAEIAIVNNCYLCLNSNGSMTNNYIGFVLEVSQQNIF